MPLYPELEPHEAGMLEVEAGNKIYFEICGNPNGEPAVVLHGGPGSGCTPWHRRLLDPETRRIILFDQRNCGRSTPHGSLPAIDLTANTTWTLVEDIERLRRHVGVTRWSLLGGSWGSVIALAYATTHPDQVTSACLFGVATGRKLEWDWLFRGGLSLFFPEEWALLCESLGTDDVIEKLAGRLQDPTTQEAAARAWCLWESATLRWPPTRELSPRFRDPAYALCFARIVIHYVRNNGWIEDDELLAKAKSLGRIPCTLVNGRFDFQSPIGNAHALHRAWPNSRLVIVDQAGHASSTALDEAILAAAR
jgi:proline iminopeptidase